MKMMVADDLETGATLQPATAAEQRRKLPRRSDNERRDGAMYDGDCTTQLRTVFRAESNQKRRERKEYIESEYCCKNTGKVCLVMGDFFSLTLKRLFAFLYSII